MKQKQRILKVIVMPLTICCMCHCTSPEERAKKIQKTDAKQLHTVVIQQMKFTPAEITVNEGDSVVWINRDIVDHNITDVTNREWASPNLPNGASWGTIVKKPVSYLCTIHTMMKGSLLVR